MNATAINNNIIAGLRMKSMIIGTKLVSWIQGLNNNEREFFYTDAGNLFTQYGLPANLLQSLVNADIGSLEDFALAISGNIGLYMFFTELTYGI